MDFLSGQGILYTSQKYGNIYQVLNKSLEIKYHELFILCAAIGFKNNQKANFTLKGREFKTNFFSRDQRSTAYAIILNDPEFGKKIEQFDDNSFVLQSRKLLEQYAEGGMNILVDRVFGAKWSGEFLDERYSEYIIDIMSFIYEEALELPF